MGKRKKIVMALFIIMAVVFTIIFSAIIIFAAEEIFPKRYTLYPTETLQKISEIDKEKSITDEKLVFGLSSDTWRKLSYCAGWAAIGYGSKSENTGMIGGGAVVIGITLYFDGDKSLFDQLSWGDAGVSILCGAVGYYAAPKKKHSLSPQSSPPPSLPPPSNPPPQSGPGPDPPLGGTGSGGDPPL